MDIKSLIIGILSTIILVLITTLIFMRQTINTQLMLNHKAEKMIEIYDKYLTDSRMMFEVVVNSRTESKR